MNPRRVSLVPFLLGVFAFLTFAGGARAVGQTETVLYSFDDGLSGGHPTSSLLFDAAGNLYGVAPNGGGHLVGAVFRVRPQPNGGWGVHAIHSFKPDEGIVPQAGLISDAAGNLYGTAPAGGPHGRGSVFELTPTPSGWTFTVIYGFTGGSDGTAPAAGVIFDSAGNLYGTTNKGGLGYGTAFQLTPSPEGWTHRVIRSFTGGSDGANPTAGLILDAAGNLYGTTTAGGDGGLGVVFRLTPTFGGHWKETVLHSFAGGNDGDKPTAGLVFDAAGNLYGTTQNGGNPTCGGCGAVFQLTPTPHGWIENVVFAFGGNDGFDGIGPGAGVILDTAGSLYGTTTYGGSRGAGTVFELVYNSGTWTETVLHSFGSSGSNDGTIPYGGLVFDTAGNLFGTTFYGGTYDYGVVFEITP